jgi:3',5'-cyclic AMP phosphodiesterase CpdA
MAISRRSALKTFLLGTAAASVAACGRHASSLATPASPTASALSEAADFSAVHLTDIHVRKKRKGDVGYRACIGDVHALARQPELALMGGDLAFDGLYTAKDEFLEQLDLYREITDSLGCPAYAAVGNHDVLGWNERRKVGVGDPELGKGPFLERLGLDRSYYSFDHRGWHFVVLDSIHPKEAEHGPSYEARLGETQLHWLAKDLGAANKPTVVMTHIAAFCNIGTMNGDPAAKAMAPGMVLLDTKDLRHVLERHGVKLVLQGHSHRTEELRFRGVTYLTSPAVSGCWWGGTWNGFQQGYSVLHFRGEEVRTEQRHYAWVHQLEPDDETERTRQTEWDAFEAEQAALLAKERA